MQVIANREHDARLSESQTATGVHHDEIVVPAHLRELSA
jgi:hypothetical protein